jgi:hypothetical protein
MRVFWSVLAVMGLLSAPEALAANFNADSIYAPKRVVDLLERGTVWQRDVGEPEPAPTIILAEARKPTKRGASGATRAAFDGRWSVIISTRSGNCDPQYRFGVRIINGNITYEGGGAANAQGRVSPSGTVAVSVSSGPQAANGQGRLSRDYGTGTWRGQGTAGVCSGTWQAWRQG